MHFIRKLKHFLSQKRKLENIFSSYKHFLEITITAAPQSIYIKANYRNYNKSELATSLGTIKGTSGLINPSISSTIFL